MKISKNLILPSVTILVALILNSCGDGDGDSSGSGDDDSNGSLNSKPLSCEEYDGNTFFVYNSDATFRGQYELLARKFDGTGVVKISGDVTQQTRVNHHKVSPNNKYVMYSTWDGSLYVACANGSGFTSVSSGTSFYSAFSRESYSTTTFKWSPNSTHIAFVSDDETPTVYELFVYEISSGITTKVSGDLVPGGDVRSFAQARAGYSSFLWAPDGSALAYLADQEINDHFELYVSTIDASSNIMVSNGIQTTSDRIHNDFNWSPNSEYITYRAEINGQDFHSYIATRDGGLNVEIKKNAPASKVVWSANSFKIAHADNVSQIIKITNKTVPPISLVGTRGYPHWSSDSNYVLSHINGNVYVSSTVDPVLGFVLAKSRIAKWSPDGKKVAYIMADQNVVYQTNVYVASQDGSGKVTVATQPSETAITDFVWSPDSQHIAYITKRYLNINGASLLELHLTSSSFDSSRKISFIIEPFEVRGNREHGVEPLSVLWSSDSQYVVYVNEQEAKFIERTISIFDIASNRHTYQEFTQLPEATFSGFIQVNN